MATHFVLVFKWLNLHRCSSRFLPYCYGSIVFNDCVLGISGDGIGGSSSSPWVL